MRKNASVHIRIQLGHESLDVTLAYLKGKDARVRNAAGTCEQQQPGAVWVKLLKPKSATAGDLLPTMPGSPVLIFRPLVSGLPFIQP